MKLRARRIPGVVRIGETHPAEPVVIRADGAEPVDGAVGHPVGVIMLACNGIEMNLTGAGVATARRVYLKLLVEVTVEAGEFLRVVLFHPFGVMKDQRRMGGEFHVVEAAMRSVFVLARHLGFVELLLRIDEGFEVRLADKCGLVVRLVVQILRDGGRIFGQRHTVHPDTMRGNILSGDHGRARGHADDVLVMRAGVVDARAGQRVDGGRLCVLLPVRADGIEAHLVGGDEEDLAAHDISPRATLREASNVYHYTLGERSRDGKGRSSLRDDLPTEKQSFFPRSTKKGRTEKPRE